MKRYLLVGFFLLLTACAKSLPPQTSIETEDPMAAWNVMQTLEPEQPYRIQFSIRFGEEGDTRRATALLWGNGKLPLRLDVMAGAGATIAKIADQPEEFLIFVPGERKAYYHTGPTRPLLNIGTPLPLKLEQLAGVLSGDFAQVFGPRPVTATIDGLSSVYGLENPPGGTVTLDSGGLPQIWELGTWKLSFSYDEDAPALPARVRLENLNGKFVILLVKEREKVEPPFSAEQLQLELPEGTPRLPLAKLK